MSEPNTTSSTSRIGIVAANHTGYVEAVLNCLDNGTVVVPLRNAEDEYRIAAAQVSEIITPTAGEAWLQRSFIPQHRDDVALIAFTSGTEGNPKGVVLTHRNLAEVVERLNNFMQVDSSISEYIGVPVYHSFGLGRCRAVCAAGGRAFIPQHFNPSEIANLLQQKQINAISAVPSLWRIVLANQDMIGVLGERVQWIEIGSQYMSQAEKVAMKRLFPNANIVQHYGLTEASRTTLLAIHATSDDKLESVGQAVGEVEVQVTSEQRIAIRGPHVAQALIVDGETQPLQDVDGWFVTKDVGELHDGYLYYQGRADDVINCGGIKVAPESVETQLYASLQCSGSLAVCRKPDPLRGDGFLLAVTPDINVDDATLYQAMANATQALGINATDAISILHVDQLPQTASGKIQRRLLTEQYQTQASNQSEPIAAPRPKTDSPIQQAFYDALKCRTLQANDTFISLGGDSLSYVQLSMTLERHIGHLPTNWEHLTIHELEALKPEQRRTSPIESSILFRALAISGVVVNHGGLLASGYIAGGAMLLFVIAGLNFARFQSDALLQGRWLQPLGTIVQNLLIPYLLVSLAYQTYKGDFDPAVIFLYSNFVGPGTSQSIFPLWFIQLLVQNMILFSVLFAVPALREIAKSSPWRFGLIVLTGAISLNLFVPLLWDTKYLYDRIPHMLIWMFILGWCLYFAQTMERKWLLSAVLLVILILVLRLDSSRTWWIIIGSLILLWIPYMPMWKLLKNSIQTLSAAAYYIFLTHMAFIHVVNKVLELNILGVGNIINFLHLNPALLKVAAALIGGVVTWWVMQALLQWLFSWWRLQFQGQKTV